MNFIPLYTNFLGDFSQSHRFTQHIKSNNFKITPSNLTSFMDFILSYSTLCLIAWMFTKPVQQCAQKRILIFSSYAQSFCNISVNERCFFFFRYLDQNLGILIATLPPLTNVPESLSNPVALPSNGKPESYYLFLLSLLLSLLKTLSACC